MSRSSQIRLQQQLLVQEQMSDNDVSAAAAEMFDMFCLATTMRQVLGLYRNICDIIGLRPSPLNEFYPKLKAKIRSWKAQALWKKFDARAAHRVYGKGNACSGTRVLVIGAGPCGLRTAIEAQLLGAKVVIIEKRDRISRNNVLHLWPFVITDLRNLGAKKFYGKFCAGSIDHISIRQLQCILLKVALLLGVEIHEGVSFERTIEPREDAGWRAAVTPEDHAVSHYEFDVLIGADGKRNTLEGFRRKEFRGKLAIAITANFINKKTEAEAKAEEISGVAFIFNQTFFKELYHTTGIDLENIVYYKDETHYFVMTAKKHSLIDKGVILQDYADPAELLSSQNVNRERLLDYAREAAEFSTKYQMPNLEFAVNHYGKPDVAMFDFTSMFAAESSCRVIVRNNFRLMQCLVGDSLLEPFWPTGSGCARGFLSSMDAAFAIKLWNNPKNSVLGVLAQRESIYRLLAQTTPENLQRDIGSYTVDPATRYPNLNRTSVNVWQVKHLVDSDDQSILEQTFIDTSYSTTTQAETVQRRKRRTGDTLPLSGVLLRWIKAQLHSYEFSHQLVELSDCLEHGKVLCALLNRYRPNLVDYNLVKDLPAVESNDIAFRVLEKELNVPRVMSAKDSVHLEMIDSKIWLNYLEQICELFRGEIPQVKHPRLEIYSSKAEKNKDTASDFSKLLQLSSKKSKSPMHDVIDLPHITQRRSVLNEEKLKRQRKHDTGQAQAETPKRAKKRRSAEKTTNIEERQQRLKEIEANRQDRQSKRRMQRFQQTQNFYKSLHMLQANNLLRESDESSPFEDYSIYMYRQQAPIFNDRVKQLEQKLLYPDRDRGIPSAILRGADDQFGDRIKAMEQRISSRNAYGTDKKPKDLMRAIGKIDSSDWNIREIEKKIEQSKKVETKNKGREKVPKWSKEQFEARQSKISRPKRQDSHEEKFKEIDQTLKNLDKQLKEGSTLDVGERGKNKVASIAGQFVKKDDTSEEKPPANTTKSNTKVALAFKKQAASEKCHFCKQTVYLMEKISTEGLVFHRSCLKCHHCHTNLRLGGYAFDRDDPEGRFYCTQHFRLPAKAVRPIVRKPGQRNSSAAKSSNPQIITNPEVLEKPRAITDNIVQMDLLDRGQTPERIEFENTDAMSDGEPSEEHIIDENEWSGRNFLQLSADSESGLSSSSDESEVSSDSEIFEEAIDNPIIHQTFQLATDWIGQQHFSNADVDDSGDDFYDSSEGLLDDGKDDTEGEDIKKAREMRREEVRLLPIPTNLPTDTETEKGKITKQKNADTRSEGLDSNADRISIKSRASDSSLLPTKIDMEKVEQNCENKLGPDIDAINEKVYRLNNLIKMNRDIKSMEKEDMVKNDILKKLSLKEKWLMSNNSRSMSAGDLYKSPSNILLSGNKENAIGNSAENKEISEQMTGEKDLSTNLENKEHTTLNLTPSQEAEAPKDSHDIGDILDIVKKMDSSYVESKDIPHRNNDEVDDDEELIDQSRKSLAGSLQKMDTMNFAEAWNSIKSQTPMSTISQQKSSVDIAKYFPNMKQEKQPAANLNRNQKTLKDVDLTKYFPQSPAPQRKASVITVADKLKQSNKEKTPAENDNLPKQQDTLKHSDNENPSSSTDNIPKRPPRRSKTTEIQKTAPPFSIREHQLDGAIDIQKAPVVKSVGVKSDVKSGKKIVSKGVKVKRVSSKKTKERAPKKKKIQDEDDEILNEILQSGQEVRSPSVEYQRLFVEEKSPSEDISEKIESILKETNIDWDMSPKTGKKLLKTKSLCEDEFGSLDEPLEMRDEHDYPGRVQKLLQRFESMSSIKSDESFSSERTRRSDQNLQRSKTSLYTSKSFSSSSTSIDNFDKTMAYLNTDWKKEASNFLEKKRHAFYAKRSDDYEVTQSRPPHVLLNQQKFDQKSEYKDTPKKPGKYPPHKKADNKTWDAKGGVKKSRSSPAKNRSDFKSLDTSDSSKSPRGSSPNKIDKKLDIRKGVFKSTRSSPTKSLKRSTNDTKDLTRKRRDSFGSTSSEEEFIKHKSPTHHKRGNLNARVYSRENSRDSTDSTIQKLGGDISRIPRSNDVKSSVLDILQRSLERRNSMGLADALKEPIHTALNVCQRTETEIDDKEIRDLANSIQPNTNSSRHGVSGIERTDKQPRKDSKLDSRVLLNDPPKVSSTALETTMEAVPNTDKVTLDSTGLVKDAEPANQILTDTNIDESPSLPAQSSSIENVTNSKPSSIENVLDKVPLNENRNNSGELSVAETDKVPKLNISRNSPLLLHDTECIANVYDSSSNTSLVDSKSNAEKKSNESPTKKVRNTEAINFSTALSEELSCQPSNHNPGGSRKSEFSSDNSKQTSPAGESKVKDKKDSNSLPLQKEVASKTLKSTPSPSIIDSKLSDSAKERQTKNQRTSVEISPLCNLPEASQQKATASPPELVKESVTGINLDRISTSHNSNDSADNNDVDAVFNEIIKELDVDEHNFEDTSLNHPTFEQSSLAHPTLSPNHLKDTDLCATKQSVLTHKAKDKRSSKSPSVKTSSRATSEDSIEKLFSQFTDDMLVDVQFDENDEIVAITPVTVLKDNNDQKHFEATEPSLTFESYFPNQMKRTNRSTSSSSISPKSAQVVAQNISDKLQPSTLPPSVQDMLRTITNKEESEEKPVAFPRLFCEYDENMSESESTKQLETSVEKTDSGKYLDVVYELAWPKRKRSPSPVPQSARPPIKPSTPLRSAKNSPEISSAEHVDMKSTEVSDGRTGMQTNQSVIENSHEKSRSSLSVVLATSEGSTTGTKDSQVHLKSQSNDELKAGSPRNEIIGGNYKNEKLLTDANESPPLINKMAEDLSYRKPSPTKSTSPTESLKETDEITTLRSKESISRLERERLANVPKARALQSNDTFKEVISIDCSQQDTQRGAENRTTSLQKDLDIQIRTSPHAAETKTNVTLSSSKTNVTSSSDAEKSKDRLKDSYSTFNQKKLSTNVNISDDDAPKRTDSPQEAEKTKLPDDVRKEAYTTINQNRDTTTKADSPVLNYSLNIIDRSKVPDTGKNNDQPNVNVNLSGRVSHDQFENIASLQRGTQAKTPVANEKEVNLMPDPNKKPTKMLPPNDETILKKAEKTKTPQMEEKSEDLVGHRKDSSSTTRQIPKSKENSLEWNMDDLPASPMPRKRHLHTRPLNYSERRSSKDNLESTGGIPLSTNRLKEWEIIEQLDRERRLDIIKRDKTYNDQILKLSTEHAPSHPTSNKDDEDVHSSKLIEYIKQETFKDSAKQMEDPTTVSSKPKSVYNKYLVDQVESKDVGRKDDQSPEYSKTTIQSNKTSLPEATYEDFARFTRKSDYDNSDHTEIENLPRPSNEIRHPSEESACSSMYMHNPTSAPVRPSRTKQRSSMSPENTIDRETKYLIDRSKHLRNMKRDFMDEKIVGRNPYMKKVIESEKDSEDDTIEIDETLESYRPKNHSSRRFPTSHTLPGRRRRTEYRYPEYSYSISDYNRRPYSPSFSSVLPSTSSTSSRNLGDLRLSPPHYKGRESSKDSCIIA